MPVNKAAWIEHMTHEGIAAAGGPRSADIDAVRRCAVLAADYVEAALGLGGKVVLDWRHLSLVWQVHGGAVIDRISLS
jgi:hypothetical protein